MPALTTIDLDGTKVAAYDYSGENELPRYAFYQKSKLKKVTLPPDLTTIGSLSFYGCTSLKELSLPLAVKKIGSEVFIDCGIQSINMPEGLSSDFFLDLQYASQLRTIFTNRQFTSHMGVVYSRDFDTIFFCPRGITTNWGDLEIDLFDTKVIESGAFQDCENITGNLFLNSHIVVIGNRAFEHCTGITGEFELPFSLRKIGSRAFAGCINLEGVTIPKRKMKDDLTTDGCYYEYDAFDDRIYDKLNIWQKVENGIPDKKTKPEPISKPQPKPDVSSPVVNENKTNPEVPVPDRAYGEYTEKTTIFYEDFSKKSDWWYVGKLNYCKEYSQNCKKGYYELTSNCPETYSTINYNLDSKFIIEQDKDFSIEADIMYVSGKDNNSNKLVWGQDEKYNRFMFGISGDGHFTIQKCENDKWFIIKPWTVSSHVKKENYITLTVRKIGNYYYFYLNKELVHKCPYQPFYGQALAFQVNENSTIRIDNIKIRYIEKK